MINSIGLPQGHRLFHSSIRSPTSRAAHHPAAGSIHRGADRRRFRGHGRQVGERFATGVRSISPPLRAITRRRHSLCMKTPFMGWSASPQSPPSSRSVQALVQCRRCPSPSERRAEQPRGPTRGRLPTPSSGFEDHIDISARPSQQVSVSGGIFSAPHQPIIMRNGASCRSVKTR